MSKVSGNEILKRIVAAGRKILPMHEYLAEADAPALDGYDRFLSSTVLDKGALEEKHREMVMACICVAAGSAQPVIANHCRRAIAAGLSRDEMLQALQITSAVFATRTLAAGVLSLMEAETS
jgi:alkylhydroperoxidase/carboxymuconolactone decarboxylase family protein YurZ